MSVNSNDKFRIFRLFLLCLAGFILGRLVVFPGFLDPVVPTHSDLYRYYSISQQVWIYSSWLTPRPLMMLSLHLLGFFHSPTTLWFILSLTSVFLATALIFVLQQFGGLKPNSISILLYSIIIFSLPTSFEIYQLDYGGMLAGILSLAAIYLWLIYRQKDATKALLYSSTMFWISLEMKPTFAATILLLAFIQFVLQRDKITFYMFFAILILSVLVILKDRLLESPFLGSGTGTEIYDVKISPRENLWALGVYVRESVTKEILPGLAISYCLLFGRSKWSVLGILGLGALAISSIFPMIIIPNRTLNLYAWYCGAVLCIPFLYIFQNGIGTWEGNLISTARARNILVSISLLVTLIALVSSSKLNSPQLYWYLKISNYNRNMITSLERLSELNVDYDFKSSKGILIAGIRGPYNPFSSRSFIRSRTGLPDSYMVLLRKSEVDWNTSLNDLGPAIYSDQLDIESFDYFVIYDQGGSISRILSLEKLTGIPTWQQIPVLACNLDPALRDWTTKIFESVAACLDGAGENAAVLEIMEHSGNLEITPVLHYYLGHAHELMGNYTSARAEYELALSADENKFFRNALEALPDK